jgi:hypothetical protein
MELMQVLQHREKWPDLVDTVDSPCVPRKAGNVLNM